MDNQLILHGLGRSGTSWLLKIFDHHPRAMCSHEPEHFIDIEALRGRDIDQATLEGYMDQLFTSRCLRSMRVRPILEKSNRFKLAHWVRLGILYGFLACEKLLKPKNQRFERMNVPDLCHTGFDFFVAKTVAHYFIMQQIVAKSANMKMIYIIRHPCGYAGSHKRGISIGKMKPEIMPNQDDLDNVFGEGVISRRGQDQLEILTYKWAVWTDVFCKLARDHPNLYILKYEDLCEDPVDVSKQLFDWAGLGWDARVDTFLQASLAASGDAVGYHDLTRNPKIAAEKWRTEMEQADIDQVLGIARHSSAYSLFETEAV